MPLAVLGLFTLFWGSFNAIRQTDLKALLAYSTISQLGLSMSLFGLGSAALNAGLSVRIRLSIRKQLLPHYFI